VIPTALGPTSALDYSPASFRDPGGRLFDLSGRLLRVVQPAAVPDLNAFLHSETAAKFVAEGSLVRGVLLDETPQFEAQPREADEPGMRVVEHERIPFPSFPYEWPAEMLHAAGILTLDLAEALLSENLGLKDATPYNVLFRGPQPVFVDWLSSECRDPGDPIWLPCAQFTRTFLMPLLAWKHFGMGTADILAARRDGLEQQVLYRWLHPLQRFRPPFLSLVSIPKWLDGNGRAGDERLYRKRSMKDVRKARFILESLFGRLRRGLERAAPYEGSSSTWTEYMSGGHCYSREQFAAKSEFVTSMLREFTPRQVLDIGCNTGYFSLLAARAGARTVAVDRDPVVVGELWRVARRENLDVLPLIVDVARPTPAMGWRNAECPSFLQRAVGGFDAVLMLALLHHLLVSERIPLSQILTLLCELTTDLAVIEFVGPEDPMFQRIARGRGHLHSDLTSEYFESQCRRYFDVVRLMQTEGHARRLYLLRRKAR
jgi:SAM-dependent methyltransferase